MDHYQKTSSASCNFYTFFTVVLLLLLVTIQCEAQLSPTFYDTTCPKALSTIRTSIRLAVSREPRMAASLICLHFHDCFVQGCDASVLLDDSLTIQSEQAAVVNINSLRGFDVIKAAKAQVESVCPGVVSCADILAVSARDASALVGGPTWQVKLGRRDSTTANLAQANKDLPKFTDNLDTLISKFDFKGLNDKDIVALSGAHSIGQARCVTFRDRVYSNGTNIDASFASTRRRNCPSLAPNGNDNLEPIYLVTANQLDNNYYKILMQKKGLFSSDQVLFNGGSTDNIVSDHNKNPKTFAADFAAAMIKVGDIQTITGQNGIIRKFCGALN